MEVSNSNSTSQKCSFFALSDQIRMNLQRRDIWRNWKIKQTKKDFIGWGKKDIGEERKQRTWGWEDKEKKSWNTFMMFNVVIDVVDIFGDFDYEIRKSFVRIFNDPKVC